MDLFREVLFPCPTVFEGISELQYDFLYASAKGDVSTCHTLITKHQVSPNFAEPIYNYTPLHFAAYGGHFLLCQLFLHYHAVATAMTQHGILPLHFAAEFGHLEICHILLVAGGGTQISSKTIWYGNTPLHNAVSSGSLGIVQLFLQWGGQLHTTDWQGRSPIFDVCRSKKGNKDILRLCLKSLSNPSLVQQPHRTYLVNASAAHQTMDPVFTTPLILTIRRQKLEMCRILLQYGANPNGTDSQRKTPLEFAIFTGNLSIVHLLIQQGADVWGPEKSHTPLYFAMRRQAYDIALCLLHTMNHVKLSKVRAYKDRQNRQEEWNMLLLEAVRQNQFPLTKALVKLGAQIWHAQDSKTKQTVFHEVVLVNGGMGNLPMCQWLLEQSPDKEMGQVRQFLGIENAQGNTALDLAASTDQNPCEALYRFLYHTIYNND